MVPVRGGNQFLGLFCAEMPESRFLDVYTVKNPDRQQILIRPLDSKFVDVCVQGSICVIAAVPDLPCSVGAFINAAAIRIELAAGPHGVAGTIVVTVSGVRKGKRGERFPTFTAEEARRNKNFWDGAYR
jgi:hypothetical protein